MKRLGMLSFWVLCLSCLFTACTDPDEALFWAIEHEEVGHVDRLLKDGANPMAKRERDQLVPLQVAANKNNEGLINVLIANGAKTDSVYVGELPLKIAITGNYDRSAAALIRGGAKFQAQPQGLEFALRWWMDETALAMLEQGADPNQVMFDSDSIHVSFLQLACRKCDTVLILAMLKAGADTELPNQEGNTALHFAVSADCFRGVEMLLDAGANPNAQNEEGDIPMDPSVVDPTLEILQLLLKRGADPNLADDGGATPLHFAAFMGKENAVLMLLEAGAKANAKDAHGETPLHRAAYMGRDRVGLHLIAAGADVNARTEIGATPARIAFEMEMRLMVDMLVEAGGRLR